MKFLLAIFVFLVLAFTSVKSAFAIEDPTASPNNKFGIHIIDENDLDMAHDLVNSSGGDWGYVTVVIREDERSVDRWQTVFNKLRRKHLIPIIRIATKQGAKGWEKPKEDEFGNWTTFLNSLNWVVKNRYVIIGNEPNQAHEWGGEMKPDEYAAYLKSFSNFLKSASNDFFVLNAGFDAAAPNSKGTMTEEKFIREMVKSDPNVFEKVDGWVSHSYPMADKSIFSQTGRGTVRTFQWELELLSSLGINKHFPIFITETGWKHSADGSSTNIGPLIKETFNTAWSDDRIVAVTPFLLNYKADPFLAFSWLKPDNTPYDFYSETQSIPKVRGVPEQNTDGSITGYVSFPIVQANHGIYGAMMVNNSGQSIWESEKLGLENGELLSHFNIEPNERKLLFFRLVAPKDAGIYTPKLQLSLDGRRFAGTKELYVRVVKLFPLFGFLLPN